MTIYNLGKNVNHTVIVDGTTYGSPFLLEGGFTIRPVLLNQNGVYAGLTSTIDNANITIAGSVYGSAGSSAFTQGRAGGMGVDLTDPGDHLLNNNNVSGGAGGNSNGGGYGGYGGAGGVGLNLVGTGSSNASSNDGAITGGAGGAGTTTYGGGGGGVGVNLSGAVLGNIGRIVGGTGGNANSSGGSAAGGGAGAVLGSGATLNNSGSLQGGSGGTAEFGGTGGAGVSLAAGATLNNQGSHSTITGGNGGYGTIGGAGGVGVSLVAGAVFTGAATIHGGDGGSSGTQAGSGGDGVDIASGATFTNSGSIVGGNGLTVYNGLFTTYAKGGAGAAVHSGTLFNFGSISAGNGVAGSLGGVYLDGGKLFTDGHIDGGSNSFAVDFGPVAGTMSVGTGASFAGDIGGFASGDVIDLLNVTPQQAQADVTRTSFYNNYGGHYVTVAITTGADGTLQFIQSYGAQTSFHYNPDGTGGTDLSIACFLKGTKIRTFGGETAVEDLDIGHRVATRDGLYKPIKWIGRRAYAGRFVATNRNVMPVRICAGALADGIPHRDLYVSPMHAMYLDGMLIPAIDLVNGTSIVQLTSVESIEYFHIELAEHDVIFAEGAATESYIDDDNRMMFLNARDYYDRYPQEVAGTIQFCAPRVSEGFELEAVRRKLAGRAGHDEPTAGRPCSLCL